MQKPLDKYKTIILDMDGTLYFQAPVRLCMGCSLVLNFLIRGLKLKELLVLRNYRRLREARAFSEDGDFEDRQTLFLSEKYSISVEKINSIVGSWMQERPLAYIRRFRDKRLVSLMNALKENGSQVVLYSDYPVAEKACAVEISADFMFHAGSAEIRCMKPSPQGLVNILRVTETSPSDALFVGDRYAKDGLCAEAAGVEYVILSKSRFVRAVRRYSGLTEG